MTDFAGWLSRGLGRAAVFLQVNDDRLWRDQLFYACTHDQNYDSQCEESRAPYLLKLIELSGESGFYRDRIVGILRGGIDEDIDLEQIFEIATSFAASGCGEMKAAMYGAFERRGFALGCAEQLVILDGLDALKFAMRSFGEVEADERPWQFRVLLEALQKHHGDVALPAEFAQFQAESEERSCSRRPGYEEVRQAILSKGRKSGMTFWGKATEAEMERLVRDVMEEIDPDRLYGFLRLFERREFPGPISRLLELARHPDSGVARMAMIALSHFSDPEVRVLALEAAQTPESYDIAVKLLSRNRDAGDWQLIERFLEETADIHAFHHLGMEIRHYVDLQKNHEAERSLLRIYEQGPCSLCRHGIVKALQAIERVPAWMQEECRFDSYSETRELMRSTENRQ